MFKANTLITKMATHLLMIWQYYKTDLYMMGKRIGDEAHSIKTINKMLKQGIIEEVVIRDRSKEYVTLRLSRKAT